MITAINLLSVIPMRKEPSHKSEMVSQLLFGEYAQILEEESQFVRIKCLYDDYEGWVQANQLMPVDEVLTTSQYVSKWTGEVFINGRRKNIPMCSPVHHTDSAAIDFHGKEVRYAIGQDGLWNSSEKQFAKSSLQEVYTRFMDTPYLWGGKSVFGIDCSGFVQQVFKMFGIKLLRDAYLQAEQGKAVENFEEAQEGDLAFFCNEKGRVTHVGIVLDDHQIVHASGKVRMDTIDKEGIMNKETGKRTHQLYSMRRYF